mmetsp:Transcript_76268/g.202540  ORF Transcript_76268/g.202540 Transcript_76268/m.202540 type:complete len:210 (-) Transcript_76268:452-1081(-)
MMTGTSVKRLSGLSLTLRTTTMSVHSLRSRGVSQTRSCRSASWPSRSSSGSRSAATSGPWRRSPGSCTTRTGTSATWLCARWSRSPTRATRRPWPPWLSTWRTSSRLSATVRCRPWPRLPTTKASAQSAAWPPAWRTSTASFATRRSRPWQRWRRRVMSVLSKQSLHASSITTRRSVGPHWRRLAVLLGWATSRPSTLAPPASRAMCLR